MFAELYVAGPNFMMGNKNRWEIGEQLRSGENLDWLGMACMAKDGGLQAG